MTRTRNRNSAPTLARVESAVTAALAALIPEGDRVLVAVSGGADSVALAAGLASCSGRWPIVGVAFVDHGLRIGAGPAAEQRAAEQAAERAGVAFYRLPVCLDPGGNLQAQARKARYLALIQLARRLEGSGSGDRVWVATGHTRTDQAETVLQRILRGSGIAGLSGLHSVRGRIVRPLLEVSRPETRAVALAFADNPSNTATRYSRSRIRALMQALAGEHAGFEGGLEATLAELANHAQGATLLLDAVARVVPDLDLRADQTGDGHTTELGLRLASTYTSHVARASGARGASAKAIEAWARALRDGKLSGQSLGDGLRGGARAGRASVFRDDDIRRMVVARQPGTYLGQALELEVVRQGLTNEMKLTTTGREGAAPRETAHEATWPEAWVNWPIRLRPALPAEFGVLGDDVDLDTGLGRGGWCVEDAAGQILLPVEGDRPFNIDAEGKLPSIRVTVRPISKRVGTGVVGTALRR